MKKIFALFAVVFGVSSLAHAGLMIEPYLGYSFGTTDSKAVGSSQEYTDNFSGSGYGLRLGYKFLLPWVALDYTGVSGTDKPGNSSVKDFDYSGYSLGAVVGVDLPVMFRLWAGYGFSNNLTMKMASGDVKAKGGYTKVGLGWTALPLLSINFEYQMNDWKKIDPGAPINEVDMDQVYSTFKNTMYLISISAPFNL